MSKLFCLLTVVSCVVSAQASYLMWQINPVFEYNCPYIGSQGTSGCARLTSTDSLKGLEADLKGDICFFFPELVNYDPMSIPVSIPADVWHGNPRKSANVGF